MRLYCLFILLGLRELLKVVWGGGGIVGDLRRVGFGGER